MNNLIDKLNARIRDKVTPEVIARAEKASASVGLQDHDTKRDFSRAANPSHPYDAEPQASGMRM